MGGRRLTAAAVKAGANVPHFKSLDRFVRYRQTVVENQLRRLRRHGFDIQPDFFLSQISSKPCRLHIAKH